MDTFAVAQEVCVLTVIGPLRAMILGMWEEDGQPLLDVVFDDGTYETIGADEAMPILEVI
jgi:hypothetical protein